MNSLPQALAQPAAIDWTPFLARPRLPAPTADTLAQLKQASILVSGAGGSIGSALSLALATLQPRRLVLLDASEQALFRLESSLAGMTPAPTFILGSVNDSDLLDEVFYRHAPTFVFHAAAYKHVALLESHPLAAIQNNAIGTLALIECARLQGPARVILLSTDKAVAPTSILGATKRIAELITLAQGGSVLRLCNVLGTEGSVVETFLRQIAAGGPVSIADAEATRYFITRAEAVDLLINCVFDTRPASLFVPALDFPHPIKALAAFLIETHADTRSGKAPIPIAISGLRAGEKLREALWQAPEKPIVYLRRGLIALHPTAPLTPDFATHIAALTDHTRNRDFPRALAIVQKLVPDYAPSDTVLSCAREFSAVEGQP